MIIIKKIFHKKFNTSNSIQRELIMLIIKSLNNIKINNSIRKLENKWGKPIAIVPKAGEIERKLSHHNIDVYIHPFPTIKYIYNGSP